MIFLINGIKIRVVELLAGNAWVSSLSVETYTTFGLPIISTTRRCALYLGVLGYCSTSMQPGVRLDT